MKTHLALLAALRNTREADQAARFAALLRGAP